MAVIPPVDVHSGRRGAFLSGVARLLSVPAIVLMASFVGFGALCRETGLTLAQSAFMTATVWALPSQVVLVGAIAGGASLIVSALAVALSAMRLTPMVAAWVPVIRSSRTPRWHLYALSHFVAITAWIVAMTELPERKPEERLPFFAGFAMSLTIANIAMTALGFQLAGALPPVLSAALFFLTPIYFLTSLAAAARIAVERIALGIGLVLGPLLHVADVPLALLWTGLIGGSFAALSSRYIARRGR